MDSAGRMSNIVGRVVGFQDRQQNNYRGFYKIVEQNFFANVVSQIINLGLLQVFYNSTTQVSESDFVDMDGEFLALFQVDDVACSQGQVYDTFDNFLAFLTLLELTHEQLVHGSIE